MAKSTAVSLHAKSHGFQSFPSTRCGGFYHGSFGYCFGFKKTTCWKVSKESALWFFQVALGRV